MQCSLYGKLPTKRDFIAIGTPREFLKVWEPWLQGGVSASRTVLAEGWQDAFLKAPIWRFWLGSNLCGRSVLGAFMPSLDGIGRYFPLTLFAVADKDAAIPPPELDAHDEWFEAAEELLMSALDSDKSFEHITAALEALPAPSTRLLDLVPETMTVLTDGTVAAEPAGQNFGDVFGSMRGFRHAPVYAGTTCWWTVGGEGFEPVALCGKGMPDPYVFASMLTRTFATQGREVPA